MSEYLSEDRNLALDTVRVTEAAALASAQLIGHGDEKAADQAAVDAMRRALNVLDIDGTVVIGEGERDEAPMLYIGEKVGTGRGPAIDIALDPLEGTTITARGGPNAIACIAMAPKGGFLNAPDTYMEKIAIGPGLPPGVVSLTDSPAENLRRVAEAKGVSVGDLVVLILRTGSGRRAPRPPGPGHGLPACARTPSGRRPRLPGSPSGARSPGLRARALRVPRRRPAPASCRSGPRRSRRG
jgi:fructose-1,6-bisphosphatase II / sedoheptulose-1,7-bisphosphatase